MIKKSNLTPRIAFLFMTIGDLYFTDLWIKYFHNNRDKINIYLHPKYHNSVKNPYFKSKIINDIQSTRWGHLVNAEISLLETALKNKDNTYFILCSDSCLPIKPFIEFYTFLLKNIPKSYVDFVSDNSYFHKIKMVIHINIHNGFAYTEIK